MSPTDKIEMADSIQFLRKKKFWVHGQSASPQDFNRLYPHLITSYVMPEMREEGYAPIYGTEDVDSIVNDDGTVSWAMSMYGLFVGDNSDLEYVTAEGYFHWSTKQAK